MAGSRPLVQAVQTIDSPDALQSLAHPVRVRIIDALREPDSAAGVARRLGEARQKVNYHLKELERAGLVLCRGERRNGQFIETLYQSTARTLVVSPRAAWGDLGRLAAMADQLSLENLVKLGERLARDAAVLLDRAVFDGEQIASAAVDGEVRLADAQQRVCIPPGVPHRGRPRVEEVQQRYRRSLPRPPWPRIPTHSERSQREWNLRADVLGFGVDRQGVARVH